ncbi:putative bifunctional diguanylate cyclase/phosphodiesterase [Vibrio ziniensis]|uniref:Bifunctional diguanylate cyclase/phosphodiesterase n=1 Tax=Vibrio ziniensis TaxID=2711221 RepID=A0A6G7CQK7_9VIBR|nr:bifunctional diguanylate cyclase/phosphodiesterase [Vibrio ziniensis]QIH44427.1 bifunctional diguanylate cyclase/phosphodiesterase [Vibrio ziniensis]
MTRNVTSAAKVAVLYALFATLWILFSDLAVETLLPSPQVRAIAQTYKGLAFVVITAGLLLAMVLKGNNALEKANDMDSLTGLHSMTMFVRTLNLTIRQLKPNEQLILGYLDIDDFKRINDAIGFEKADAFLRDLAQALNDALLPGSFASRLHADQFASFAKITNEYDMDEHMQDIQRMYTHLAKDYGIESTCCISIALYPQDGSTAKELMVSATEALNVAKEKKNAIQYHDKALTEKAMQRRQMMLDLRNAIDNGGLSVVYQPKYDLDTLNVNGVEVLVRWNHPTKGYIAPDVFIPLAENHGLTGAISKLVINKVANELSPTNLLGNQIKAIAVNVSAAEFNNAEEMQELVRFIKEQKAIAPYINIEITETATLDNLNNSVEVISSLQQSGIAISIDDFGTGYTSLAMLKDLTVDEIKIDRSYISEVENDDRSRTIISAIIAMTNSFGINLVAEGVETESQLKILQKMGCQQAQGYYLGRPMPVQQLLQHLI